MTDFQELFEYDLEIPKRLDKFLVEQLPSFSRSQLQNLIREGAVSVDGFPAQKAGQLLEGEGAIAVRLPPHINHELIPEAITLEIVYDDHNLMIVNKPTGMVVHPAAGHATGTLVHAALAHSPELRELTDSQRPGIVHRLDKNTSGLIIVAKNEPAHQWLQEQFRSRKVNKTYLALVDGHPPTPDGRIETPIGRSATSRKQMAVVSTQKGRNAITEYHTIERFVRHSYLEVHPITGRMHQIRIHLDFIGCPVVGDTIYGFRKPSLPLKRYFLHATRLSVTLPGETEPRTFAAELPEELSLLLENLKNNQ